MVLIRFLQSGQQIRVVGIDLKFCSWWVLLRTSDLFENLSDAQSQHSA